MEKAKKEIEISRPYFQLLGNKTLNKNLRTFLIKYAPPEFFSVLSQIVRHLLNGSFCVKNSQYCEKYRNALYLLALPTTKLLDKQKIIEAENSDFLDTLYKEFCKKAHLKNE